MKRIAFLATTISAIGVLAGCGTPPNPLMGSGHTPAYVDGFNDGCTSGRQSQDVVAGSYTKNSKRFDSDPQYAQGWTAGYNKCGYAQMEEDASGGRR